MRVLYVLMVVFVLFACKKSQDKSSASDVCSGPAKTFSSDVDPVIQASCALAGCHATGSTNGPGPLVTYSQVFNARSNIRLAVSSGAMPKNGTLSTTQRN